MRPNSPRGRVIPFKNKIIGVSEITPLRVEFLDSKHFFISQNLKGLSAKKIYVLNLHICRLVGAKYYTHKSRGL